MASTEHNTAYWEVQEQREFSLHNGETRAIRTSRTYWGCFDWLVTVAGYTPQELIEVAEQEAAFQGVGFEDLFPDGMAYMEREVRRAWGMERE